MHEHWLNDDESGGESEWRGQGLLTPAMHHEPGVHGEHGPPEKKNSQCRWCDHGLPLVLTAWSREPRVADTVGSKEGLGRARVASTC